ncbi:uncharacterized protein B0P05DRAFT_466364 [Gilbertella persicaria]|uniref:uncharacterized protein n=1 Tax=Gilbertella persicaria TaxID=101096 RepID=UPI0022210AE9|nr:uncharacterized protein B0P05DRAFT_466364 [Gilbertella persicaria]KAI8085949.1 hypothetical protein B0P05DRAFT_466364 [Gilbertella persicaria]
MNHYNHYLVKYTQLNLCENDYLRTVWSSILEFLFPPKEKVRIIIGESENKHTTKEKAYLYRNSSNIHGFKINIRLVVDIGGDEADLVVSECAKNDEDNKIIQDEEKLLRKSKDALDGMIQNVSGSDCCLAAYFTQFNGTSCALSTTHLAANGLYVST